MPGFEKVRKNLEAHGFDVTCFDTAAEAADYLDRRLDEAEQDAIRGELFTAAPSPSRSWASSIGSRATPWCAATGWETASQTQPPPRSI